MLRNLFLVFAFIITTANTFSQENFKIGEQIPDFKLWFIDGDKLTKNDILNKAVVFKFWFTSCLPCLLDIKKLNTLVDKYKHRDDILFIAPALERRDIIKQFIKENTFKFKIAYSAMDVSQIFNKKQVSPSYFIIDKKGKFSYIDSGTKQSYFENLKNAIAGTLKE